MLSRVAAILLRAEVLLQGAGALLQSVAAMLQSSAAMLLRSAAMLQSVSAMLPAPCEDEILIIPIFIPQGVKLRATRNPILGIMKEGLPPPSQTPEDEHLEEALGLVDR